MMANNLKGMSCPKCGSHDSFLISVEMVVRVTHDDSKLASSGDHDWHDDSDCMCEDSDCEFTGKVRDFYGGGRPDAGNYQVRDTTSEIPVTGTKDECETWAERHNAKVVAAGGDPCFVAERRT